MKKYLRKPYTVSYLCYHLIFCPRLRKKIFADPLVKEKMEEETRKICKSLEVALFSLEIGEDYVYFRVQSYPELDAKSLVRTLKKKTQMALREAFPDTFQSMPSLWTLKFFVSTEEEITRKVLQEYVNEQRTRY